MEASLIPRSRKPGSRPMPWRVRDDGEKLPESEHVPRVSTLGHFQRDAIDVDKKIPSLQAESTVTWDRNIPLHLVCR